MNIQSEIDFFSDLCPVDKARFIMRLIGEVCEESKIGGSHGMSRLKFVTEMNQRMARFAYQILSEDTSRPPDDVLVRMLLSARADKQCERIMQNSYRRVLASFETFDTTVLLNNQ